MSAAPFSFTVPAGSRPVFVGADGRLLDAPLAELLDRTIPLAA